MKYLFYTILLAVALGTGAAILNPALIQQGAMLIGLELPQRTDPSAEATSSEDQLAQFLAQYPLANNRENTVVPAANVPMVVVPEPASPPILPVYTAPATPFPMGPPAPTVESAAPAYTQPWNNADHSRWDGEAATPIHAPPVVEHQPPMDWSGPAQPYQEPVPAPEQSVYAAVPREEVFPVIQDVPGFARTSAQMEHAPPPQPVQPSTAILQTPAAQIESIPVLGTEMVARVGTQIILMGDILPKLRRIALKIVDENIKKMSAEERAKIPPQEIEQVVNTFVAQHYPEILQEQILFTLVYCDYISTSDRASQNMFTEKMGDEFDRNVVPELMAEFNAANVADLKKFLEEQLGSSLEKERRLWIREEIVRQWIGMSMQRVTGECTHDEMSDFYERNKAVFTSSARARWQEMIVLLSRHDTEQQAWDKIRWMGNQVVGGAPFEEIAKANSDGFTASDGGVWDWTSKGSLASAELEQAIFTQPIGQLSPAIIKSDRGFHIIRVLERQEENVVPFLEAQSEIRKRIRNQRSQQYQEEYFSDLRRRFPTMIVKDRIDFNAPQTASN